MVTLLWALNQKLIILLEWPYTSSNYRQCVFKYTSVIVRVSMVLSILSAQGLKELAGMRDFNLIRKLIAEVLPIMIINPQYMLKQIEVRLGTDITEWRQNLGHQETTWTTHQWVVGNKRWSAKQLSHENTEAAPYNCSCSSGEHWLKSVDVSSSQWTPPK